MELAYFIKYPGFLMKRSEVSGDQLISLALSGAGQMAKNIQILSPFHSGEPPNRIPNRFEKPYSDS